MNPTFYASCRRGFTLVEVVAVIVIISAISVLIIPRYTTTLSTARLRKSTRDLFLMARYAKQFSVTKRRACRLTIDRSQNCFDLEYQSDPERQPHLYKPLRIDRIKKTKLGEGLEFANILIDAEGRRQTESEAILFRPLGTSNAAVVQITNGHRTWSVIVEPGTGRIDIENQPIHELPIDRVDLDA